MDEFATIARSAEITNASSSGFKLLVIREELVPKIFRQNLTMQPLVGSKGVFEIEPMQLKITGVVKRASVVRAGKYELGVDFTDDAPEYWRECLMELLPGPNGFPEEHTE